MNNLKNEFYIVSLKHTSKGDTALTFWGANGSGYTWHKDRAGIYSKEEAEKCESSDNPKVPKENVDKFWIKATDFNDHYISVPNHPAVLFALGLSDKEMKPKRFKTCKMVFVTLNTKLKEIFNLIT